MDAGSRGMASWVCWALLGAWAIGATFVPGTMMEESLTPLPMLYMALAILHAWIGFGWRGAGLLIAAAYAIGFAAETTSIHTGFPFGWYVHTDVLGIKLAAVPLFIPLGFFTISYLAWMIVRPIVEEGRGRSLLWTPIVTGLVASSFDLATDAIGATVHGYWIYRYPTGIYGVPLTNYLGWILTTWAIGLAFSLLAPKFDRTPPIGERGFWSQPALFWAIAALQFPLSYYVQGYGADSVEAVTRDARSWMVGDVYEGAVIVALLAMLPPALAALARIWGSPAPHS